MRADDQQMTEAGPDQEGRPADLLTTRLQALETSMPPTILRVARYLDRNRVAVLAHSAAELATMIGTSDATIVRTVQALGFQGLSELRQVVATSIGQSTQPADSMRRTLATLSAEADQAAAAVANLVLDTHAASLRQLQASRIRARIHAAITQLHPVQRIVIYGAGPSLALAEYLAIMLNRHGRPAKVIGHGGIGLADQLLDFSERDGLLLLSYGTPYREVLVTAAEAEGCRMPIVLVTDNTKTPLAQAANVIIPAQRGRAEQVALHGTTLIALEAVVMGLAVANRGHTMQTLERLGALRAALAGAKDDLKA
jgi:DNA-binding MurR/RpiR family transcriptional regulator